MPFDVRLPDGTLVRDVPDGTTKEQLAVKLRAKGFTIPDEWMRRSSKGPSSRYVSIDPIPKGPSSRGALGAKELMPADQLRRFATVQLPGLADAAASLGAGATGTVLGSAAALGSRAVSPMVMNAPNQMDDIARQSIASALSRKPQTELGQNILSGISKAVKPVTRPVSRAIESGYQGIGQLAGPKTEMVAREAGQSVADTINALPALYGGMKAFGAAENLGKQAALAKALQDSQKIARTPDEIASAAGFRISSFDRSHATGVPKQNVSRIGVELDKFSGNRSEIRNAIHNKTAANSLVAKDIGLPDGALLTDDALSAAAKPHYAVYDSIRDALKRPFKLDDELLMQEAKAAAARTSGPIDIPKKDLRIVNKLGGPIDGGRMLKYIDELRTEGFRNLRTPSAGSEKLARYYLDLANALESRLGRVLAQKGMPDLANQYQNARRAIAKIETAKAARVGYDIDPAYLARLDSATNKLDGGMKIIAETYKHFPRNFRIRVGVEENLVSPFGAEASSLLGARSLAGVVHSKFFSTVKGFDDPKYVGPDGPLRQFYRPLAQTPPPAGLLPRRGEVTMTGYTPSPPGMTPRYPWGDSRVAPSSVKRLPSPNDTLSGGTAYKPSRASIVEKPFDAISHPGSANRMPEPERLMLAEAIAKRGAQNEGIPLADILIEPGAKKKMGKRAGRKVRIIEQGEALKPGAEKMTAAPGAVERGMALEMALQGKKVPKQHRTFLARAIEQRAKKEK